MRQGPLPTHCPWLKLSFKAYTISTLFHFGTVLKPRVTALH